ncbi:hypothetical protein FVO59_15300 [Microbacterium esteraromaticum]|uniref:Uncharacterized protein n=1 Tax=Microbacterium esteraromaticum TaxID=57043 RepID=A0A7D7WH22_9MICO|nr:hypothetical protein [Microbacterium esteraromaticum]QMU98392.1 hypothetical protein FVO59_15300 [Microbacterium esteraromaticum]
MTTATLHLASPTPFERLLQQLADALAAHVVRRIAARTERRELGLELLRQQQTRRHDPHEVDHLLAIVGLTGR